MEKPKIIRKTVSLTERSVDMLNEIFEVDNFMTESEAVRMLISYYYHQEKISESISRIRKNNRYRDNY